MKNPDTPLLQKERREKKLDEVFKLVKENNKLLRGDRNTRKVKMLLVVVVFLSVCGYGYYLFEKYKLRIVETQERIEDLREHLQELRSLKDDIEQTVGSIQRVLIGPGSDSGEEDLDR